MTDEIKTAVPDELIALVKREFALSLDDIHGIAHWGRVLENGLRIAGMVGADRRVVEYFTFLHDSKRLSNGFDLEHGKRAVEFARSIRDDLIDLEDGAFELLLYACEHHTAGMTEADVTVQTCWDADRLDLGRIGIKPDPKYLCTDVAKDPAMIEWAYRRSRSGKS